MFGVAAERADGGGDVDHHVGLSGLQPGTEQVPGAHMGRLCAPVSVVNPGDQISDVCCHDNQTSGDTNTPSVGAGQDRPRAAPGHLGYMKVPLQASRMLKSVVARDLRKEGSNHWTC